ncbi:MAG: protein-L-isoaspartate(D-aspartate) O-methyltransferase [Candidatus Nanohaloarchaea archaeon]|jgi:protein-L-isoaspartate(D-aspartate) O-methyltransferase
MDLDGMVDRLKQKNHLKSEEVEKAFRNVDRAVFVPEKYRMSAYEDQPLPIGEEETISAPHMVAINTELLEPESDDRIVEVGSGSGYQVAVLAEIADEVTGIEINMDLVDQSRENLEKAGIENVEIIRGSGLEPVKGGFDRILYSCAVPPEKFESAKKRLTEKGVLVAPVEENGTQVVKKFRAESGEVTRHGRVRFVGFKQESNSD